MTPRSGASRAARELGAWSLALAAAALALALLGYRTRDPDSALYARMAADLAGRPTSAWIAPIWPPGAYMQGYFREHPIGAFVPAALLARLGYPGEQAAYAMSGVYQAGTLLLVARLAAAVAPEPGARALACFLQLLPIAFTFRVRANHEPMLLMFFVAALLGVERSRRDARWAALTVAGGGGLLLVKGMLVVPALAACAAWAWLRPAEDESPRAMLGVAAAALGLAVLVVAYEASYRAATGESFLGYYLGRWLGEGQPLGLAERITSWGYVFFWYTARVVWFAFPWSLFALAAVPAAVRALRERRLAAFPLLVTLLYLAPLAGSDRKAERYIFPVYFVVAAFGLWSAFARLPRLAAFAARLERRPHAVVLVWVALFVLHLAAGYLKLPRIKLWAPDS